MILKKIISFLVALSICSSCNGQIKKKYIDKCNGGLSYETLTSDAIMFNYPMDIRVREEEYQAVLSFWYDLAGSANALTHQQRLLKNYKEKVEKSGRLSGVKKEKYMIFLDKVFNEKLEYCGLEAVYNSDIREPISSSYNKDTKEYKDWGSNLSLYINRGGRALASFELYYDESNESVVLQSIGYLVE